MSSKMEINCLPNEILEKVFARLDGVSLSHSRQTCRLWNEIVSNLERSNHSIWKNRCLTEIEEGVLMELLGNKKPTIYWSNEFWLKIYILFYRSGRIKSCPCLRKRVPLPDIKPITCIKVSGDCLITGNDSGNVWLWDAAIGNVIQPLLKHKKPVTDIVLVDLFNLAKYEALDCKTAHHHVITAGKDRQIKIAPLQISNNGTEFTVQSINMSSPIDCLRIFDDKLVAKSYEGYITIWKMEMSEPSAMTMQLFDINFLEKPVTLKCRWMGFWDDELTCITSCVDKFKFSTIENRWISIHAPNLIPSNECDALGDVVVKTCFLFRRKIIVFITANNYLCISADGQNYRAYSTLTSLKCSNVTAVNVFCNLLILGTSIGSIHIYSFQEDEDLLCLDLDKPLWAKAFSNDAIVAIDICLDQRKTLMAAVTKDSIYVVHWIIPLRNGDL